MLSNRFSAQTALRISSTFQTASFSTKKGFKLPPGSVDVVFNPNDEYMKSFMTGIGAKKTNFKLSDHYIWKDTFKDDYKMIFFCLKDTKKVMACYKQIMQRPLPTHDNVDEAFYGFMYVDEEYRGTDILKIVDKTCKAEATNFKNIVGYMVNASYSFWMRMFPTSTTLFNLNLTMYDAENVKIPSPNLVFDDIIVKSAHDVADDDITKYDQTIYPYERKEYMLRHLRDPEGHGKVAYDRDGKVIGIGTVTVFPSGDATLFPMYGDNDRVIQAMFQQCLTDIEKTGKKIKRFEARMPIVEGFDNTSWMRPFLTHEPNPTFLGRFLYTKHKPVGFNLKKVYCVVFPSVCSL